MLPGSAPLTASQAAWLSRRPEPLMLTTVKRSWQAADSRSNRESEMTRLPTVLEKPMGLAMLAARTFTWLVWFAWLVWLVWSASFSPAPAPAVSS